MLYQEPEEPTTVIIEHTTTPVIERTTIVERDSWWSEPWAISLSLGAIALIGLFAYWALYNPMTTQTVVEHTTIDRTMPSERAEVIAPPSTVIVNPPANRSNVNVNPPATNQPTVKVDGNGSNSSYDSDSNDNSSNDDANSSDDDSNSSSEKHSTGD